MSDPIEVLDFWLGEVGPEGGPSRAAAVWSELASAMLGDAPAPGNSDAVNLADAFDGAPADASRDMAVLAGLRTTAEACRDATPAESSVLRQRLTRLLGGLRPLVRTLLARGFDRVFRPYRLVLD